MQVGKELQLCHQMDKNVYVICHLTRLYTLFTWVPHQVENHHCQQQISSEPNDGLTIAVH